jgi:hypothetical protein
MTCQQSVGREWCNDMNGRRQLPVQIPRVTGQLVTLSGYQQHTLGAAEYLAPSLPVSFVLQLSQALLVRL